MRRKKPQNFFEKARDYIVETFKNLKYEFSMLPTVQQVVISVVAVVVVASSTVAVAAIAVYGSNIPTDTESSQDSSSGGDASGDYDPDEFEIDEDNLPASVLKKTQDAGEEYLKDTMFLGDSNTVGYHTNGFLPLENVAGVESMGIAAVPSHPCVYYAGQEKPIAMPQAVALQQPRRVIINFGTNNLIGMTTEQFISAYEKSIVSIKEAYPSVDIIIGSIVPLAKIHENKLISQKTVDQFNLALVDMALAKDYKFLNYNDILKNGDGFMKSEYVSSLDGIHLVAAGHEAILKYVRTHVYETEDKRPKPLKAQPKRKMPPVTTTEKTTTTTGDTTTTTKSTVTSTTTSTTSVAVDKTNLTAAIAAANAKKTNVKSSTDGVDVLTTDHWATPAAITALNNAIIAATTIKDKATATQAEVNSATTAMQNATGAFVPIGGSATPTTQATTATPTTADPVTTVATVTTTTI